MGYPTGEQIDRIIHDQQESDATYRVMHRELPRLIRVAREAVLQVVGHGEVGRRAADAVEEALRRGSP